MTGVPTIPKRSHFLLDLPRCVSPAGSLHLEQNPGTLRAIDASTLKELWNSEKPGGSDTLGNVAKFTPVTIANGKVYVPTFSNKLVVYGLKKP